MHSDLLSHNPDAHEQSRAFEPQGFGTQSAERMRPPAVLIAQTLPDAQGVPGQDAVASEPPVPVGFWLPLGLGCVAATPCLGVFLASDELHPLAKIRKRPSSMCGTTATDRCRANTTL